MTTTYIDLNLSLKVHPLTKDLVLDKNDVAIRNAVKHLSLYGPYDNPYDFGTEYAGIYDSLFELTGSRTARTMIYTKLKSIILANEPRVIVDDIDVITINDNGIDVIIKYTIKSTGLPDQIKFSVIRAT